MTPLESILFILVIIFFVIGIFFAYLLGKEKGKKEALGNIENDI